tara:strand:+ start:1269 stop:1541 length:273 start_codon:yes stop_codon:yes gene_type:complete
MTEKEKRKVVPCCSPDRRLQLVKPDYNGRWHILGVRKSFKSVNDLFNLERYDFYVDSKSDVMRDWNNYRSRNRQSALRCQDDGLVLAVDV